MAVKHSPRIDVTNGVGNFGLLTVNDKSAAHAKAGAKSTQDSTNNFQPRMRVLRESLN
jgi:hypothetical protein